VVEQKRKNIQIFLIDDHLLVREGLRQMLEQEEDMVVVGQAASAEEALSKLEKITPDIVLMDIKMSGVDGIQLTRMVKEKHPSLKIIMLTLYDQYLAQSMDAGASGYLLKDVEREELSQSIRQVHGGKVVISEKITPRVRIEEKDREKIAEGAAPKFGEVLLVILPPVDANQLLIFTSETEAVLVGNLRQVVGSWRQGIAITMSLINEMPQAEIIARLKNMPEVKEVEEKMPEGEIAAQLFRKATAMSKSESGTYSTLFLTLQTGES